MMHDPKTTETENRSYTILLDRLAMLTERSALQQERSIAQEAATEKFSFAFVRILELVNRNSELITGNSERIAEFKGEAKADFREIESLVRQVERDMDRYQDGVTAQSRWLQDTLRELMAAVSKILTEIKNGRVGSVPPEDLAKIHAALETMLPQVDVIHRRTGWGDHLHHFLAVGTGAGLTIGILSTLIQLGILHMGIGK